MRELIENIGDVNPIDYDGIFIYKTGDKTGEVEVLSVIGDDSDGMPTKWQVSRFVLEQHTYENGILSDDKFHKNHPVWYSKDIEHVANCYDIPVNELIDLLCSDDIISRAMGYHIIWSWYGLHNFDEYPLEYTNRGHVYARYKTILTNNYTV